MELNRSSERHSTEWFELSGHYELFPTEKLLTVLQRGMPWPTASITMQELELRLSPDEINQTFSPDFGGSPDPTPMSYQIMVRHLVARRIAGDEFPDWEQTVREDYMKACVAWKLWSEDTADASLDALVTQLEELICQTTGLPRPKKPVSKIKLVNQGIEK